jgi:hypothetical protein
MINPVGWTVSIIYVPTVLTMVSVNDNDSKTRITSKGLIVENLYNTRNDIRKETVEYLQKVWTLQLYVVTIQQNVRNALKLSLSRFRRKSLSQIINKLES